MSELHDTVAEELRALRELRPGWLLGAAYEDPEATLNPLDQRERQRLAHLGRQLNQGWRERTRERVARERKQPWDAEEWWGIRKRVWRERRDAERELLDVREGAILRRDDDMRGWLPLYRRRLAELAALAPDTAPWCAAMARDEADPPDADDLSALWERYRAACAQRADELLARPALRERLATLVGRNDEALVAAAVSLAEDETIPPIAGVLAALLSGGDRRP